MTEVIKEREVVDSPPTKIKIPVKTGHGEERVIELKLRSRVTEIVDIVAAERGCRVEELVLIRDGDDEPLTSIVLIEADYPHKRRHHVHLAGDVEVTVYYQAGQDTRRFRRSATVEDVLTWAIAVFKVDPSMASEFELTRHGQKEELPGTEHIGHLAGAQRDLALDLVRGDIANGSCA
ncbi:hypothetical protein GCM10010869_28960 [Mesorhizobium tianshanense]|uniref:Ubiquitin-like domain-containing protein n=1 Tax=Mesorhizobium tianshanense TaxID=39844 RepID=A0A562NGB2_9HYPH|nr:hypothetical protein [Mesorhizobium tianshanense]TWI31110.1 hypothetical protein IQ26_04613 [Mesorhizobium tianshanense]GLS37303.1 hypothetical protein GCM10010869_28960 [Mesorhizobium tianshanense]